MLNKNLILFVLFLSLAVAPLFGSSNIPVPDAKSVSYEEQFNAYSSKLYADLHQADLSKKALELALKGYFNLKGLGLLGTKKLITLVDFSKPSSQKRFYVIDLEKRKVVFHSLVAHGRNSGEDLANSFSNDDKSYKSSLGFYVTGETYEGKHGFSMRLDGMEKGINDNARERAIVMHAADYVNNDFVKVHGRLGRSHGCPALPEAINAQVIEMIKGGTCLFLYAPQQDYLSKSTFLDVNAPGKMIAGL
jgi:hypothetical protein